MTVTITCKGPPKYPLIMSLGVPYLSIVTPNEPQYMLLRAFLFVKLQY